MYMTGGVKFDNVSYNINTWYNIFNENSINNNVLIVNQGVNNGLTQGTIFVSLRTDNETENTATSNPRLITLFPGDNFTVNYDAKIWVQADTENVCLHYSYIQEG